MVQRLGADVVVSTVAIALKLKAGAAHDAGRRHEAELLLKQGLILLDALAEIRQVSEELDSIRLVRVDLPDRKGGTL
jgi:hypothetical protein